MLRSMAGCGISKTDSHMTRNLHRLIHRTAKTVDVRISTIAAPIRSSKRGQPFKARIVQYPLLLVSDWSQAIFKRGGHFWMAGHTLDAAVTFGETLTTFWGRYQKIDPALTFFEASEDWSRCIPFALHGDEGRGKDKKPILVLSAQPLITSPDMAASNLAG